MTENILPNVSRETMEKLEIYAALLAKWNPRINLVSKATIADVWRRHIWDSVQVFDLVKHPINRWVDLGSGGGFPGVVIAFMSKDIGSPIEVTLVESDQRKSAFLRTVLRETNTWAKVVSERIEAIAPLNADVISARALAGLDQLLHLATPHIAENGTMLFHKGEKWQSEVSAARENWYFTCNPTKSHTNAASVVLRLTGVARV